MKPKPDLEGAKATARCLLSAAKLMTAPNKGIDGFQRDATEAVASMHFASEEGAKFVGAAASGDASAREAVHYAIAWYVANRVDLPDRLRDYLFELLFQGDAKRKRGGVPHKNYLRDDLIRCAVRAVESHGFSPTRNIATMAPSACSIVRDALDECGVAMTEKNVEAIASAS